MLAARLEEVDEELVPWAPLLAAPLDVEVETTPEVSDLDPAFWRARLHGVMGTLLGQLLDSPTLFVFDDVHWMDDASSELLRYLGTQLSTRPVAHLYDATAHRGRIRGRRGHAAAPRLDAPTGAASRRGRENPLRSQQQVTAV